MSESKQSGDDTISVLNNNLQVLNEDLVSNSAAPIVYQFNFPKAEEIKSANPVPAKFEKKTSYIGQFGAFPSGKMLKPNNADDNEGEIPLI